MVYLARAEDTETATISWNFDFTNEQLIINSVSIKFESKTYENGVVDLQILNGQGMGLHSYLRLTIISIFYLQGRQYKQWLN